jgi:hypothetical protein
MFPKARFAMELILKTGAIEVGEMMDWLPSLD